MLDPTMERALNAHLDAETYSAYLYFSMSAYFESKGLKGFANWMRVQALEELGHAGKFYDYILSRGGRVRLGQIAAPPSDWETPLAVFEATMAHERMITSKVNELAALADELTDRATTIFLQWFVSEQVEEESSVSEILERLRLVEGVAGGLFVIDRELASRVFTPPQQ